MNVLEFRARSTDAEIQALVDAFYRRARQDALLGPVFEAHVPAGAWPAHLARITAFWSTVLRGTGRYEGDPIKAHLPLHGVTDAHFERWLALFAETVHSAFEAEIAAAIVLRAERMAVRLRTAMGLGSTGSG